MHRVKSNDMSAERGHQPSLHDLKATTDIEPTAAWAAWVARHRSTSDDKFNPHSAFSFHLAFAGALAIAIAYAFARAPVISIIAITMPSHIHIDLAYSVTKAS
jgi:hypothetical protein